MHPIVVGHHVLKMLIKLSLFTIAFQIFYVFFDFFLSSCFISYQEMDVKTSDIDYGFGYFPFSLVKFCFMYLEALLITTLFLSFFFFCHAARVPAMAVKVLNFNNWIARESPQVLDFYSFLKSCLFITMKYIMVIFFVLRSI